MIRFFAKHRHLITAVVAVVFISAMVYFGVRMNRLRDMNIQSETYAGTAFGTAIKKNIYAENVGKCEELNKQIDDCLDSLEKQISVRIPESEISGCNANYAVDGIYRLSPNILGYLKEELAIAKETNGAYSPCIRPLSSLWGIEDGKTEIPAKKDIQAALKTVNVEDIEVVENGVTLHAQNMGLDFGASGKGIACDEVALLLADAQIEGAVISIGGSILTYGDKGDGRSWHIGIQDPRDKEGEVLGVVDVEGHKIISTSGDYEKYFEKDGKRYHHIIDPATGYPADSGLISVTIISDNGLLSDAMSTACFVMGREKGMEYVETKGVDAIFVTSEKEVYVTKGIRKKFRLQADGYKLVK